MTGLDRAQRVFPDCFTVAESGCWEWTRGKLPQGYGVVSIAGRPWRAHRALFEILAGPIPDGLGLDHLCRNRCCVNPDHLEPVTTRENLMRGATLAARNAVKTHCPRGHAYDEANTRQHNGRRFCRACESQRRREQRAEDAA
jgi:hypothetical protein